MEDVILTPGFIGLSGGWSNNNEIQAVIWGGEEEVYFFPVSYDQGQELMEWYRDDGDRTDLMGIVPEAKAGELAMFTGEAFTWTIP